MNYVSSWVVICIRHSCKESLSRNCDCVGYELEVIVILHTGGINWVLMKIIGVSTSPFVCYHQ